MLLRDILSQRYQPFRGIIAPDEESDATLTSKSLRVQDSLLKMDYMLADEYKKALTNIVPEVASYGFGVLCIYAGLARINIQLLPQNIMIKAIDAKNTHSLVEVYQERYTYVETAVSKVDLPEASFEDLFGSLWPQRIGLFDPRLSLSERLEKVDPPLYEYAVISHLYYTGHPGANRLAEFKGPYRGEPVTAADLKLIFDKRGDRMYREVARILKVKDAVEQANEWLPELPWAQKKAPYLRQTLPQLFNTYRLSMMKAVWYPEKARDLQFEFTAQLMMYILCQQIDIVYYSHVPLGAGVNPPPVDKALVTQTRQHRQDLYMVVYIFENGKVRYYDIHGNLPMIALFETSEEKFIKVLEPRRYTHEAIYTLIYLDHLCKDRDIRAYVNRTAPRLPVDAIYLDLYTRAKKVLNAYRTNMLSRT